jgi:hypothetical protein
LTSQEIINIQLVNLAVNQQQVCPIRKRMMEHKFYPAVVQIGLQLWFIQIPWEIVDYP